MKVKDIAALIANKNPEEEVSFHLLTRTEIELMTDTTIDDDSFDRVVYTIADQVTDRDYIRSIVFAN